MIEFSEKCALITGASTGIGRELARIFAAEGHDLVLTARSADRLEALAADLQKNHAIQVTCIAADLADPASPQHLFDQIRSRAVSIDILVNNAGFGTHGRFWQNDPAEELALVQVNITSLIALTRLFLPGMIQRGRGRILNVASTAAFLPGPLMANYYASKAFVLSFSQALSNELSGTGVTMTALCPGPTPTEFQRRAGMTESRLSKVAGLSAERVARVGYDALMAGKRVAIPGIQNRILAMASRFFPTWAVLKVARRLNDSR